MRFSPQANCKVYNTLFVKKKNINILHMGKPSHDSKDK